MKILMIDNFDSFTYNLVQYLETAGGTRPEVIRNNKLAEVDPAAYDAVVISPGPGIPEEAGDLLPFLKRIDPSTPVLGVCLGHQAMGIHFGGKLTQLKQVYHGVSTHVLREAKTPLLENLPDSIEVGRYHSWVIAPNSLPDALQVTSRDESGQIMSMEHKQQPWYGIQYHPESIMTEAGMQIIENFIQICRK
jgi:anthranilate synthase component II